jgi:hypothetical protein
MDESKRQVLQEIGYEIPSTCFTCKHGEFNNLKSLSDLWGTCAAQEYQHLKHTGEKRHLSVYAGGRCNKFEQHDGKSAHIGAFLEFFKT